MSPSHWGRPPADSTPEAHWEKGERCEELGERIAQRGAAREWALVLFFYAALHYTKAKIIAEAGAWADTHRGREGVPGHNDLVREFLPSQIVPHYMHLYNLSNEVRYRFVHDEGNVRATIDEARDRLGMIRAACRL